ncbi:hypothetical protein COBT_000904 [Conglomerata obtusa]
MNDIDTLIEKDAALNFHFEANPIIKQMKITMIKNYLMDNFSDEINYLKTSRDVDIEQIDFNFEKTEFYPQYTQEERNVIKTLMYKFHYILQNNTKFNNFICRHENTDAVKNTSGTGTDFYGADSNAGNFITGNIDDFETIDLTTSSSESMSDICKEKQDILENACNFGDYRCINDYNNGLCEVCFKILIFMIFFEINEEETFIKINDFYFHRLVSQEPNFLTNIYYILMHCESPESFYQSYPDVYLGRFKYTHSIKIYRRNLYETLIGIGINLKLISKQCNCYNKQYSENFGHTKNNNNYTNRSKLISDINNLMFEITKSLYYHRKNHIQIYKLKEQLEKCNSDIKLQVETVLENYVFLAYDLAQNDKLVIEMNVFETYYISCKNLKLNQHSIYYNIGTFIAANATILSYYNNLFYYYEFLARILTIRYEFALKKHLPAIYFLNDALLEAHLCEDVSILENTYIYKYQHTKDFINCLKRFS